MEFFDFLRSEKSSSELTLDSVLDQSLTAMETVATESASAVLIQMIDKEYQQEQRIEYRGLRALCEATRNLPVYPNLSEKEKNKLKTWTKEVTKALTKKKSPSAQKLTEMKHTILTNRGAGKEQNKPITAVELKQFVPELTAMLKTYLDSFLKQHPNLRSYCIKFFVLVLLNIVMGPFSFLSF
uniref:Uncharacterized protein n=1 Tax=Plectus sambesii TaxID=2011161 RepID=A0A914W326_9BILA